MGTYIVGRIVQLLPVLVLISIIVFAIMHLLPGDPALLMLAGAEGGAIGPERLAELRQQMGLNEPLLTQYWNFLSGALTGDLGNSLRHREPVLDMILDRLGSTMELAVAGIACSLAIGVPLGIVASVRQGGWIDAFCMTLSYLGASVPVYWLALMLVFIFAFNLAWFPSSGGGSLDRLVLPALSLGLINAGLIARLVRSSMIEVLREDYMRTGRAKGLPPRLLLWRHGIKNAMIPVVTMVGLQFGNMLAGTVVTETVFSRPGVGRMVVNAIIAKDYPLVQGSVLFLAVLYVLVNLAVDIAYAWLDPRIHYGR
ncbi:nickel ABC transporter permease [Devosia sp. 919]|uniref:nickel ABC transporter permease n=1 Tax=Devosia sp. 919 TaxID=2726065 RepID=UPI0015582402|nr:nickel ABC transporter permease [Devosia sp. 919]